MLLNGDNVSWLESVYNRNLEGRNAFLLFNLSMGTGGKVGYNISVNHAINQNLPSDASIPAEDAELMRDPLENFLGWQAGKQQEPGKLFNKFLMQETIAFMSQQLQAVRMAKNTGMDPVEAMKATCAAALAQMPSAPTTTDPMLAAHQQAVQPQTATNPAAVFENNTQPFVNPPAANLDPVSNNPVQTQPTSGATFNQPDFATMNGGFGGFGQNGSNPFGGK